MYEKERNYRFLKVKVLNKKEREQKKNTNISLKRKVNEMLSTASSLEKTKDFWKEKETRDYW